METPRQFAGILLIGTTNADEDYHACYRLSRKSDYAPALCGTECHLTPREWGRDRQYRPDSCNRCARKVRDLWRAAEAARLARGPQSLAYLRASTDKQTESPDTQLGICETYCRRQGLAAPVVYSDVATSGGVPLAERPAGARLLRDAGRGDHVIVARLDRLSRNFLDFAITIDAWSKAGVTLHPCDFPMVVKPDDLLSNAFVHMLAIFAQHERRLIGERIKEALGHRIEQGRKVGGNARLGFMHEKRGPHWYRVECPYESEICLKAAELALAGYARGQIAHAASG
jgi:DNA invertase Pin-like site-specific DNA recombinase